MVKRPEWWNKELYDKLSFEYLIECAEKKKKKIDKWNALYQEYLESEWKRLYPEMDSIDILELVKRDSLVKR
ncbi:MAG: hypothetical protein PHQ11_15420, partial [Paludibacter sp.]|nr:hypothetical protein [Paludibacter sp.]